jgi:hypothetical protein
MVNGHHGEDGSRPAAGGGHATFEIIGGAPSAEEIAAVTVALTARLTVAAGHRVTAQRSAAIRTTGKGGWGDRSRTLRLPVSHGPGAWRASGRP